MPKSLYYTSTILVAFSDILDTIKHTGRVSRKVGWVFGWMKNGCGIYWENVKINPYISNVFIY